MNEDVSGNEMEIKEDIEESEVVSEESEEVIEESSEKAESQNEKHEFSEIYSTVDVPSYDYTSYLENLQTIGILICALLVALGLVTCFCKGFKR